MVARIIEVHNKTVIPIAGAFITITGYWLWTVTLSGVYSNTNKTHLLYHLHHGFIYHHGRDLAWWLILILTLAAVIVFELAVQSLRKVYYPDEVDLFQVWQKDPTIRARFKEVLRQEEEGMNLQEEDKDEDATEVTGTVKEMLDARPDRLKRKDEKRLQKERDANLGVKKDHRFGVGHLTRKKNELDDDIEMRDVEKREA